MATGSTTKAKMQYINVPSEDLIQIVGQGGAVLFAINANGGYQVVPQVISASGAISPFVPNTYVITKAGVAAMTLAAPAAGVDDGNLIEIISATAFAHTVTATGLLQTGTAFVNSVTFPAQAGASIGLMAYQGKWILQYGNYVAGAATYVQMYTLA